MFFEWTYIHWVTLGAILLIAEMSLGIGFFLWMSFGAFVTGLACYLLPSLPYTTQFILFLASSIVSGVLWWFYQKDSLPETDNPALNQRAKRLIGEIGVIEVAVVNNSGKVRVADLVWKASGDDLGVGTKVKIVAENNMLLRVEKISPVSKSKGFSIGVFSPLEGKD